MLLIPVTHIISILGLWPFQLPPLTLTLCVSVILAHIGLLNSEINIFVRHARGHIFQHLEESILVLGEDDRIVDHNPKASEWFDALGIDLVSCSLQSIMDRLAANGAEIKEGPDDNNDTDITLFGDTFIEVYSLRTYKITDRKKRKIGAIAIFTDVTKNRDLFKRMEEKVGIDPLTGLPNRMAYEGARNRLDTSAFYPLSVIVCDANGLKKVNDTLGHKYGDKMLQIIAESLEAACPKPGFIARIGGDEFIYLLPNTDPGKAQTVIERIRETLTNRAKNTSFDLSIACGAATKFSGEEDLENVISLADARMYENKLQIKEARSNAKMVNDSDIITK
jgi:diguanylate cyclase (GGDEF)-like protein